MRGFKLFLSILTSLTFVGVMILVFYNLKNSISEFIVICSYALLALELTILAIIFFESESEIKKQKISFLSKNFRDIVERLNDKGMLENNSNVITKSSGERISSIPEILKDIFKAYANSIADI